MDEHEFMNKFDTIRAKTNVNHVDQDTTKTPNKNIYMIITSPTMGTITIS